MRTNIPSFRLPEQVLDDEVGTILNMGVDIRYNSPVGSMRSLLEQGFDAIFVGTGAPRGKELICPAAANRSHSHRNRLAGIGRVRPHRQDRREGSDHRRRQHCDGLLPHLSKTWRERYQVMARRPRGYFKASAWELDDAEEEGIDILINHAPNAS
jgi:hypothetical protein